MIAGARYTHTNLIARDWRTLAEFYESLFGCVPVSPERDYSGPEVAALTSVPGAALRGAHLLLPGGGPDGSTLEIFEYAPLEAGPTPAINRPGLAHIAFAVDSVADARAQVLAAGGSAVGEIVELTNPIGRRGSLPATSPTPRATSSSCSRGPRLRM